MEKLTAYKSSDGKLFESETDCKLYELKEKFKKLTNTETMNRTDWLAFNKLWENICSHKEEVIDILSKI